MGPLEIFIGAGIGLFILAIGIGIGVAVRRGRGDEALPLLETVSTNCASQLAETATLTQTAKELSEVCRRHIPPLSRQIVLGADTMLRASSSLQRQMESLNELMVAFQKSRAQADAAEASGNQTVARIARERKFLEDRPKMKVRHSARKLMFDVWQYVAPYDGVSYPSAAAFELVHCTGSSSEGFSYFSKSAPRTDKLIVAVGSPSSLQFYISEALQNRPTTVDGESGHLTACLFIEKLTGVYRWDNSQCRIALNLDSVTV